MYLVISMMLVVLLVFSGSVLYGLYWAVKNGPGPKGKSGELSIFDEEEPIGRVTDNFPGETWGAKKVKG